MDTIRGIQTELTNWSKSARSSCFVYKVNSVEDIARALAVARAEHLTVIPHGAGHSYTDAALNTGGIILDVTPMRRILSWDPAHGIMCVEPGATLRAVVQTAAKDGWWPFVSPSTPDVTIGGCVAMNVNGRNAWKCGPFGSHVLSLDVLLMSGELLTLASGRDSGLLCAFIGSMGLLGILTSITLQLQRNPSGRLNIRRRSAASLDETLSLFAEEEAESDFMEAWLDGFARGDHLGRGILTCATIANEGRSAAYPVKAPGLIGRLEKPLTKLSASLGRPVLLPIAQLANRLNYRWGQATQRGPQQQRLLFPYTFWPSYALSGYHTMFPEGVETFHAFVPKLHAKEIFRKVLCCSQQQDCIPIWCIIKRHQADPFLLSYQVDGFSLELNYQHTSQVAPTLERVLRQMIAFVIEAGGRFYLAKDHFLTSTQYRQSVGEEAFDTFLRIKQRYDPELLLQSDLFRRIFQPSLLKEIHT